MATVGSLMVTTFQTVAADLIGSAAEDLAESAAKYLVVTAEENTPLALLSLDQVRSQELSVLPVVPVVSEDADLDDAVRELAPKLLETRGLLGAVVLWNGKVSGILPRELIAQHASRLLTVRGFGYVLPGNPIVPPPLYVCPNGDYQQKVTFYDRHNPPRCPYDRSLLVRKV